MIIRVAYGLEVVDDNDKYVDIAEAAMDCFNIVFQPGRYMVQTFPSLRHIPSWFPGAKFRHDAAEFAKVFDEMRNKPFDAVLATQASLTVIISGFAYPM